MKHWVFIALFICNVPLCAQEIHSENIFIEYEDTPLRYNKKLRVNIDGGFNDSIYIFINNHLIRRDIYITDKSLGVTGKFIEIKVSANMTPKIMMIKCVHSPAVFEMVLDWRYKNLHISKYKTVNDSSIKWFIRYKNKSLITE